MAVREKLSFGLKNGPRAADILPARGGSVNAELAWLEFHHGPGFGDHGSRVAQLAVAAAGFLSLERHEVERLWFSSLIHDLGKTDVDPGILDKRDPLTDLEVAEVQRHPQTGHDFISGLVHPAVADYVRQNGLYQSKDSTGVG